MRGQLDISYDAFIRTTDPKHEVRTTHAIEPQPPDPLLFMGWLC